MNKITIILILLCLLFSTGCGGNLRKDSSIRLNYISNHPELSPSVKSGIKGGFYTEGMTKEDFDIIAVPLSKYMKEVIDSNSEIYWKCFGLYQWYGPCNGLKKFYFENGILVKILN